MATLTENSYLAEKIDLRIRYLPAADPVRVLDCFSADGLLWKQVQERTGRKIKTLRIEKTKGRKGTYLLGDNLKYMTSLDLSRFDVVDLDAFGVPYAQLKILFERNYRGSVFVTYIQSMFGALPPAMLREIGFNQAMIKKCPSLFTRHGRDYFLSFLALYGIQKVQVISFARKHYLHFRLDSPKKP